ncbi:hypothetical protein BGZ83_002536 [Gryganskiella cystojenkinii]|nr:hypothetical protein BGZ83_002536 [Gryganskiella cystojenkinii]
MTLSTFLMPCIAGATIVVTLVSFGLDIFRAVEFYTSKGYLVLLLVADTWGLLPYALLTLRRKTLSQVTVFHQTLQILDRVIFLILALIPSCWELARTSGLVFDTIPGEDEFDRFNRFAQLFQDPSVTDRINLDFGIVCWGSFGKEMKSLLQFQDGPSTTLFCGVFQSRTVLMLITGVLVAIEMVLFMSTSKNRKETATRKGDVEKGAGSR